MELTKQQKAGALIAALALSALGVDRLLLGGGGPASASAQDLASAAPLVDTTAARPAAGAPSNSLASRLAEFADAEALDPSTDVPDLFSQSRWTLRGVFGEGVRGGVKIGDELVHVGGEYAGAKLLRVSRTGATFSKAGREFFVALEVPSLGTERPDAVTPDISPRG
ncbi:MAG: hypothetical protein IT431_16065 [Phycisphaerales bacterium]|nr:hypothetical protein [Phycisphaerales bacterium]